MSAVHLVIPLPIPIWLKVGPAFTSLMRPGGVIRDKDPEFFRRRALLKVRPLEGSTGGVFSWRMTPTSATCPARGDAGVTQDWQRRRSERGQDWVAPHEVQLQGPQ